MSLKAYLLCYFPGQGEMENAHKYVYGKWKRITQRNIVKVVDDDNGILMKNGIIII